MSVRVMINKGSLLHISKDREILIREENFAYLLPCDKLKNIISNFTITFPNRTDFLLPKTFKPIIQCTSRYQYEIFFPIGEDK